MFLVSSCSCLCAVYWSQVQVLTLNVREPSYLGLTRSISCLLMPWLLASPGHQQPYYWLCRYVESPSMVDPQWDIWYWGSKWNLQTVCWSAVGCEWGTTSVYFRITYVCFVPSRLPVFAVEPQYLLQDFFIFVKSIIWRTHTKSSKNFMLA